MGQHFFDIENIDNGLEKPIWLDKTVKQYYFFMQGSVSIQFKQKLRVSTGFQMQYLWDESLDVLIDVYDIHTGSLVKSKHSAGLDVIYKKWDYGVKVGLEYDLSQHFFLTCTYYQGLKRIDLPEFKYLYPRTNASLGIGIGIKFSTKK
ncbi:MAG: hypothetical protein RLZZ292_1609 [Bacteroidota bacterium]|jgi:hypothetical protein